MQNLKNYEAMAKLDLPETERQWISERANMLLSGFGELESINTAEVEPLVTVLDLQNILREDVCVKILPREELLANAPEQYDGYFQVPKTLD